MMPPEDMRGFYAAPFDRTPLPEDAERQLTDLSEQYDALVEQGEAEGLRPGRRSLPSKRRRAL